LLQVIQIAKETAANWRCSFCHLASKPISGQSQGPSLTGWGIFIFCIVVVGIAPQGMIRPYGAVLEAGFFLVFALAWAVVGNQPIAQARSTYQASKCSSAAMVIKIFGIVLLLGAAKFGYEFVIRRKALLR
jgi:hypothetical protein